MYGGLAPERVRQLRKTIVSDQELQQRQLLLQQLQQQQQPQQQRQSKKQQRFTPEDNRRLLELVKEHGKNWLVIASFMPGRNARQCRDRFERFVNPKINHDPWTPEEDRLLIQRQSELGNKWALIAKFFSGRTDVNIQNRFYRIQRRQQLRQLRQQQRQPKQQEEEKQPTFPPRQPLPSLEDTLKDTGMAIGKINKIMNAGILSISK